MDKPSYKLVGAPCGQHGQYTFYKAIRFTRPHERIVAIGDFFFVKIWQDSELVSIGELQLLWTDRVSDQTLVSLRLYFLPENTPDGRCQHGEDEVLAINDKVVVRAEDLVSWVWSGAGWRWGLRAVWRGACAPEPPAAAPSAPLHHTRLDFSDVDHEKSNMTVEADRPGVVVFSYPRYCRYRALLARLEGVQAAWLRDALVAALGGYAAPTTNTRILYCKDTFEYPELEGHEFVCNHLAPKLKGRPRGRRRRAPDHSPSDRSSDSDPQTHRVCLPPRDPQTPRRLSLRNGAEKRHRSEDEEERERTESAEDSAFMTQLRNFYARTDRAHSLRGIPHLSLRELYRGVAARGGYEAVCRRKLWRALHADQPARTRRLYEKYLLPYENHERRNGSKLFKLTNGALDDIPTIEVAESPLREPAPLPAPLPLAAKRLRTPSPHVERRGGRDDLDITTKPAEELNREFLDSLPKEPKIHVKPVEQLLESELDKASVSQVLEDDAALASGLAAKHSVTGSGRVIDEIATDALAENSAMFLKELSQKLNLGPTDTKDSGGVSSSALSSLCSLGDKYAVNGHAAADQKARPAGRSSLRAVRVKPARPHHAANTPPIPATSSESPVTNFGIHRPPPALPPPQPPQPPAASDDDIVEVPYKPKTPEIIDLDEYPESPQHVKNMKLDLLRDRGLEVTAVAPAPPAPPAPAWPPALLLDPAVRHQLMTQQAHIFQMYNIMPPALPLNGVRPPKVIQATCTYGSPGPEKTVYGNPKDPFMPPPHILHGAPVKPQRVPAPATPPRDVLDLTCKAEAGPKPAVEIVRVPPAPSPTTTAAQNLSKNYTLLDGKAVVGSNLEITLVNPKAQVTPTKRPSLKRSSNGQFVSNKTPTPPKDYKPYPSPKKTPNPLVVPNVQSNSRDDASPTGSTGSKDSSSAQNAFKPNLAQLLEMQKSSLPTVSQFMEPVYGALCGGLGHMDQRQLALYRDFVAHQFRGYSLLNIGTPTTKN